VAKKRNDPVAKRRGTSPQALPEPDMSLSSENPLDQHKEVLVGAIFLATIKPTNKIKK
jgi:hypothetical protein